MRGLASCTALAGAFLAWFGRLDAFNVVALALALRSSWWYATEIISKSRTTYGTKPELGWWL